MEKSALIIGAGFAGSVCARELADKGWKVKVMDKRSHIAGNAYDKYDDNGILIHEYGPHIFHTNSKKILEFLSRFTDWRFYEHRVLAKVGENLHPIPINRTTINGLYNLNLEENEVEEFLEKRRIKFEKITTSEEVVLGSVGEELCNFFFRGYTKKQWGLDLSELSSGVASRIPTRTNDDDRYFTDTYQFMPLNGYTEMFANMLNHENIEIELGVEFNKKDKDTFDKIIFTGPIDLYFDYCFGKLPYRSLKFGHKHLKDSDKFQDVGTVNYPNDFNYTRITEFKYLTGQKAKGTSLVYEYPQAEGEPYYPIPRKENEALYQKYKALAEEEKNVIFVGRLAEYRYYNMDQVIGAALAKCEIL